MGLVKKAVEENPSAGAPGSLDISTVIRRAVADEIERQRLEKQKAETERDAAQSD